MCIKIQLLSFFHAMCADSAFRVYLWQSFYLYTMLTRHEKTSWCLFTLVLCIPCLGMSSYSEPIPYQLLNREEHHNGTFKLSSDVYQPHLGKSHPGWNKEHIPYREAYIEFRAPAMWPRQEGYSPGNLVTQCSRKQPLFAHTVSLLFYNMCVPQCLLSPFMLNAVTWAIWVTPKCLWGKAKWPCGSSLKCYNSLTLCMPDKCLFSEPVTHIHF